MPHSERTMCRMERSKTRKIRTGDIYIGGDAPVTVQSMTNTDTRDAASTIDQIKRLEEAGCDIVRVAVPDSQAADALKQIKKSIRIPLVADIHFDYRLALASIENGADKIRINPGNIGGTDRVKKVVEAARSRGIPIRIGVNSDRWRSPFLQGTDRQRLKQWSKARWGMPGYLRSLDSMISSFR